MTIIETILNMDLDGKTSIDVEMPDNKKVTIPIADNKPMLNCVEAIKFLCNGGGKVRVFYAGENHKYLTLVHEDGKLPYIAEMTDNGLIAWTPNPTVQDLLHDCFKIIEVE
jgi:hypothetical protein